MNLKVNQNDAPEGCIAKPEYAGGNPCHGCAFHIVDPEDGDLCDMDEGPSCFPWRREDGCSVIFVLKEDA